MLRSAIKFIGSKRIKTTSVNSIQNKNPYKQLSISGLSHFVSSKGFEPPSSEPESKILSIELRGHFF